MPFPRRPARSRTDSLPPPPAQTLFQPWRPDLSAVPAGNRRTLRYALVLIALDEVNRQDHDVVTSLWSLLHPLFDLGALEQAILATRAEHRDNDEDDGDIVDMRPPSRVDIRPLLACRLQGRHTREFAEKVLDRLDLEDLGQRLAALDDGLPTHPTVALLAGCLGLAATEARLLDYLEKHGNENFRAVLREFPGTDPQSNLVRISSTLGMEIEEVRRAQDRRGGLRQLDFINRGRGACDLEDALAPTDFLRELLFAAPASRDALTAVLFDPCEPGEWTLADFPHLEQAARRSLPVLAQAAGDLECGVNALLYGPPGSGKTEFARALIKEAKLMAFKVKTQDEDGDALSRSGRLSAWRLAQRLLAQQRDVVLIFDEAEDVFQRTAGNFMLALFDEDDGASSKDKGWINEMLETNPVPTLWISNRVSHMDKAFLRRFLLPVAFHTPPRSVRRSMVERHLGGLGLSETLRTLLAEDEKLTPGQLASAARVARLLQAEAPAQVESLVRDSLAASRTLLHGSPHPRRRRGGLEADMAFLNLGGNFTPAQLVTALHNQGRGSLLCYGPSGTGKTSFAETLARALDRELVVRHASDLLAPYVGQTEAQLAEMFQAADPRRSVLLLDEADSFLRDRRSARQSWEATQVNELLQQMERFDGIFICATNLFASLDPAALRRFDFSVEFRALTAPQRLALFAREVHDGSMDEVAPDHRARLGALTRLTPGDFTTVCRQFDLLGTPRLPSDFLMRLEDAHRLKRQLEKEPVAA